MEVKITLYFIASLYYLDFWRQQLCISRRCAKCEERCYWALSTDSSSSGLQVAKANVNESEVESGATVNHLVEELHGQRDQLDHSIITVAYRDITENNVLMAILHLL